MWAALSNADMFLIQAIEKLIAEFLKFPADGAPSVFYDC